MRALADRGRDRDDDPRNSAYNEFGYNEARDIPKVETFPCRVLQCSLVLDIRGSPYNEVIPLEKFFVIGSFYCTVELETGRSILIKRLFRYQDQRN